MDKCATCKHWSDDHGDVGDDWRVCARIYFGDAIAQSMCLQEGIKGELLTKGEFGCVLHEKAPEQA